jgi:hypothetical protein
MEYNDEVKEYLAHYPDMVDILPKAIEAAKRHFPEKEVVVDVYQDPEIEDCYIEVKVLGCELNDVNLDRLTDAEREYIDELAGKEGWIQLNLDLDPHFSFSDADTPGC